MLLVIFRIGGTAIDASEVTAVSNRNSQVGNLPAEFVLQCHGAKSSEKQKARFSLGQGGKHKPCNPDWNRAHTWKAYSGAALLSNRANCCEWLARVPAYMPDRVREAPAFPPEPSSQISGSPRWPQDVSPGRPPRSELQRKSTPARSSLQTT